MSWFSEAVKQTQKEADKGLKNLQKGADAALGQATGGKLGTTSSMQSAAGKSSPSTGSIPTFNIPTPIVATPTKVANAPIVAAQAAAETVIGKASSVSGGGGVFNTDQDFTKIDVAKGAETTYKDAVSAVAETVSKVPTPAAQAAAAVTNAGFVPTPAGVAAGLSVQAGAVPTPAGVGLKAAQEMTGYKVPTPAGVFAEEAIKWGAFPTPAGVIVKAAQDVTGYTVPTIGGAFVEESIKQGKFPTPAGWILDQFINPDDSFKSSGTEAQPLPEVPTFNDNQSFQDIETATTKGDQMTEEERLRRIRRLMLNRYGREDTILTGTADTTRRRRTAPGFMGM